jgi:hypothetical protein
MYSLHGVMKREYINIGIGKYEIKRTSRDLVAVRKTAKKYAFLKKQSIKILVTSWWVDVKATMNVAVPQQKNLWIKKNLLDGLGQPYVHILGQPYVHILACHYFS